METKFHKIKQTKSYVYLIALRFRMLAAAKKKNNNNNKILSQVQREIFGNNLLL